MKAIKIWPDTRLHMPLPLWPDFGHNAECLQARTVHQGVIGYSSPPKNSFFLRFLLLFFFLFEGGSRVMGKRVIHCTCECSPTHHDSAAACCLTKHQRPLLLLELHVSTEG